MSATAEKMTHMAQTQNNMAADAAGAAPPGLATEQGGVKTVKIEFYDGAKAIFVFHLPDGSQMKIETSRSNYWVPDWLGKIAKYLYQHGRRREVKTYNPAVHREYVWQFYEAEMLAEELLHMIKSAKTWRMSKHARRIVELLERLNV
jgi:hypothetical protein